MNLRMLPLGSILIGLCLFFLPFLTVSCSQQPLVTFAGTDLAFGLKPKPLPAFRQMEHFANEDLLSDDDRPGKKSKAAQELDDNKLNGFVAAAFGLGMIAALLAYLYGEGRLSLGGLGGGAALLAVVLLIVARYHIASNFEDKAAEQTLGLITLEFGPGFYGPLIAFGLGGFLLLTGVHHKWSTPSAGPAKAPMSGEDEITD